MPARKHSSHPAGVRGGTAYVESHRDIYGYAPALYREAGADSIFVPAFPDNDRIAQLVRDVVLPLIDQWAKFIH